MKTFIWLLNIVLVLSLLVAGCDSGRPLKVKVLEDGKQVGELTLTPETKKGKLPTKYGYVDGPRSLAVAKDGQKTIIYLVPEGAMKADRKENKEGVTDKDKREKISSWIFKIVLDKDGKIEKVQRSSYFFEHASPADIALGKDGKNAYVTVEAQKPEKNGLYRINLDKDGAFKKIKEGEEKPFPLEGPVSLFTGKGQLGVADDVQLRGVVLVKSKSTANGDVLYVTDTKRPQKDPEGNQIWKLEYKKSNGEMKLDKKSIIMKQSHITQPQQKQLFKHLFGIALDPIQTSTANLLYLTTHPLHNVPSPAPGKVLLVNIQKKEVKELVSDAWYGVDITTVNRNGTRWVFALAEGKEKNKTSGEIISIRLKQAQGNEFEAETVHKIQGFYACHSIAFPSGDQRGFIAQVGDNYLYSFSMEDLWKILARRRIGVKIGKDGKITVTPNPAVVANGDYVQWHIEANDWGAKKFELTLPGGKDSPFGNLDNDIKPKFDTWASDRN